MKDSEVMMEDVELAIISNPSFIQIFSDYGDSWELARMILVL